MRNSFSPSSHVKEQRRVKFKGRTATALILFPPDKVLLVKRRTLPFNGYWALPGGRVDPGETVEETIVREVREETGLDVAIIKKIGGKIEKQESEIEEIKLFSLDNVPTPLAFEHSQMIEAFVAGKRKT